jgi:hypothetical protein
MHDRGKNLGEKRSGREVISLQKEDAALQERLQALKFSV